MPPLPADGVSGVGAISGAPGSIVVRGPGMAFYLRQLGTQSSNLARPGEMMALRDLRPGQTGSPFLHRVEVSGLPELNRMGTDLHFAVHATCRIEAGEVVTPLIDGPMTMNGGMTVNGALSVKAGADGKKGRIKAADVTITPSTGISKPAR